MEIITFKNTEERDKGLGLIIGKQVIKFISQTEFGVANGTAERLKNEGIKIKSVR